MTAAWVGYFIAATLVYGLVSRLFLWIFARKLRTLSRLTMVHASALFGIAGSINTSGFLPVETFLYVVAATLWFVFDFARLKPPASA